MHSYLAAIAEVCGTTLQLLVARDLPNDHLHDKHELFFAGERVGYPEHATVAWFERWFGWNILASQTDHDRLGSREPRACPPAAASLAAERKASTDEPEPLCGDTAVRWGELGHRS